MPTPRYWVAGTGSWNQPATHWANTSGGAPGAGNTPTSSDNANFDNLSNATDYTVTLTSGATCAAFNINKPLTGTLTFAGSATLLAYGNYNCQASSNIVFGSGVAVEMLGSGSLSITTNGVTQGQLIIGSQYAGPTASLQDDATFTTVGLWGGTFDSNDYDFNAASFDTLGNDASTIAVVMGSSIWTLSGGGDNFSDINGHFTSIDFGTSTLILNAASAQTLNEYAGIGALAYGSIPNLVLGNTSTDGVTLYLDDYNTTNLTVDNLTLSPGSTTQLSAYSTGYGLATSTITAEGTSGSPIILKSASAGDPAQISQASGTVTFKHTTITDITATGGATFKASVSDGNVDGGGNTGIDFSATATLGRLSLNINQAVNRASTY